MRKGGTGSTTGARLHGLLTRVPLWFIVLIWAIPSLGLFINSFRDRQAQNQSGWWRVVPSDLTISNYDTVLSASSTASMTDSVLNSLGIAIPATIIPIAVAAFAAYGFAWIDFKGRNWLFIATISLLAIPLQVALLPLLKLYVGGAHVTVPFTERTLTLIPDWDLQGSLTAVWLTHTGFAMPFAIFLLHNYISGLPRDIFESARIDGADHFTIFTKLVLPLSVPVLAAFAIFQFLWAWNDYLIALTMIGSNADNFPTTIRVANLSGDFGRNAFLLPSAAFIQAFIPLIVFFSLQRFFVKGLLAGSVKG
ncbi:MAG: carbohydrate ABC transporter permease [Acidimicrobiales bacterium]|nr:carbohydrate ABC transporter permease [Acidimicrobiales bacterium]